MTKIFQIALFAAGAGLLAWLLTRASRFKSLLDAEIEKFAAEALKKDAEKIDEEYVLTLPKPVRRYYYDVLKKPSTSIRLVKIEYSGLFRTDGKKAFKTIRGAEWIASDPPGFVWHGRMKMAPLLWITAKDKYVNGRGGMLIKMLSAFTLGDVKGKEMDQSGLFRVLSEAPFIPTLFFSKRYLRWEALNENAAKAVIDDGRLTASAVFYFNSIGEIVHTVSQDKFMWADGKMNREKWSGSFASYRSVDGVKAPCEFEATWHLQSGDFTYARLVTTSVEAEPM